MSSFICSSKHFNSLERSVIFLTQDTNFYFPYSFKESIPELYEKRYYTQDTIDARVKDIIDTLRELNVICVSLQYKHHYSGTLDKEIAGQLEIVKTKDGSKILDKISLFKSLQCLDYQIELDHLKELRNLTPEEDTAINFIKQFKNHLAVEIVRGLPAYDNAPWGID